MAHYQVRPGFDDRKRQPALPGGGFEAALHAPMHADHQRVHALMGGTHRSPESFRADRPGEVGEREDAHGQAFGTKHDALLAASRDARLTQGFLGVAKTGLAAVEGVVVGQAHGVETGIGKRAGAGRVGPEPKPSAVKNRLGAERAFEVPEHQVGAREERPGESKRRRGAVLPHQASDSPSEHHVAGGGDDHLLRPGERGAERNRQPEQDPTAIHGSGLWRVPAPRTTSPTAVGAAGSRPAACATLCRSGARLSVG